MSRRDIQVRDIIRSWSIKLRDNVKPLDIIHYIPGLTKGDIECVERRTINDGNQRGMDGLLDIIPRRDKPVFFQFLVALERENYRDIAQGIINQYRLGDFRELADAREIILEGNPNTAFQQNYGTSYNHHSQHDGYQSVVLYERRWNEGCTPPRHPPLSPPSPIQSLASLPIANSSPSEYQPRGGSRSLQPPQSQHRHRGSKRGPKERNIGLDDHLNDIPSAIFKRWAKEIKEDWEELGEHFGLSRRGIKEIGKSENPPVELLDAICSHEKYFTVADFINLLRDSGLVNKADWVEGELGIKRNENPEPRAQGSVSNGIDNSTRTEETPEVVDVRLGASLGSGNDNFNDLNAKPSPDKLNIPVGDDVNNSVEENDPGLKETDHIQNEAGGTLKGSRRGTVSNDLSHRSSNSEKLNAVGDDNDLERNDAKQPQESDDFPQDGPGGPCNPLDDGNRGETKSTSKSDDGSNGKIVEVDLSKGDDLPGTVVFVAPEKNLEKLSELRMDQEGTGKNSRETSQGKAGSGIFVEAQQGKYREADDKRTCIEVDGGGEETPDTDDDSGTGKASLKSTHESGHLDWSLLSCKSQTVPKEYENSRPRNLTNERGQHTTQPVEDPDNYDRRKPLLSPGPSSMGNLPSFGSKVMIYGARNPSQQGSGGATVAQGLEPPVPSETDVGTRLKERAEIVHPSSYEGSRETESVNREQKQTDVESCSEGPIVAHPSSYVSHDRQANRQSQDTSDGSKNMAAECNQSEAVVTHPSSYTGNSVQQDNVDGENVARMQTTVLHRIPNTVAHPSSYTDESTEPKIQNENDEGALPPGNEENIPKGNEITHPSSVRLSDTPRAAIIQQPESSAFRNTVNTTERAESATGFVTQPESAGHNDCSSQGQNPIQLDREEGRKSLIVTHPDSYGGETEVNGETGSSVSRVQVSESENNAIIGHPESYQQRSSSCGSGETRTTVTQVSDQSSKSAEKNLETQASELRVEQANQMNMDSFRDVQNSIPGTEPRGQCTHDLPATNHVVRNEGNMAGREDDCETNAKDPV